MKTFFSLPFDSSIAFDKLIYCVLGNAENFSSFPADTCSYNTSSIRQVSSKF